MRQDRHRVGRKLALVALAFLVFLASAVPVMADPAEPEPPAAGEHLLRASEYGTPSPAETDADYRVWQREKEEREHELGEQPFVAQRESSRHAYAEDNTSEAEELLRSTFGETFAELNKEPARRLGEVKLDENLGNGAAVITDEGRSEILEADMPVEAKNAEGETEKVDLALERGPEGFEPQNPVTEVSIGETAEEGVEIGEEGLTVTQVGAEESPGRLLGEKNVFFGEVEEGSDTDLVVSPTAHGVELFDMLRSVDSPETLRFELEVPDGDALRKGPGGGAEIVGPEGNAVTLVPPPHAEDAQGKEVPVELGIEGDSIVLRTDHRSEDLDYPILIDPEVFQEWGWWYAGNNLQGLADWQFQQNGGFQMYHWEPEERENWPGWSGGLFLGFPNGLVEAGDGAEYYLNTPNTNVSLTNVEINPYEMALGECGFYTEPYDYEGYWVPGAPGHYSKIEFNDARYQHWTDNKEGARGVQYDFGLGVDVAFENQCWHDLAAGGISFDMGDSVEPTMLSATSSAPGGWINGSTPFTIHVAATDGGLGVKEFGFAPDEQNPGNPVPRAVGCVGDYESLCPTTYEHAFSFVAAEFPKGEDNLSVTARSPTEKRSNSEPVTIKVDTEPPVLHLNGQLATAIQQAGPGEEQGEGGPELTQPLYNLEVEATDGVEGTTEGKLKQSGVETVEVSVTDATGNKVESTKAFPNPKSPCAQGSCAEALTYPIPMTGLPAGKHHVLVKAWDFAGNAPATIEREFEYFPATGLTEEDVTQRFLLPDGKEHGEGSYQGPELAVNVMNGNVVYHQRDVEVEGPTTNLEVELFYNSQLPKEESSEFGRGWTLSQTPSLEPMPSGKMATALTSESALTGNVALPQKAGEGHFSDKLGAYIEKESDGEYAVSDEGGEDSLATVYDSKGQATEVQTSPTAGVEYEYQGEHLSEIAVDDPGATTLPPPPVKKMPSYVSSFGSAGSGEGQFSHPADVALDQKGDEWVVDSESKRVEEFSPEGEFIKSLASPQGEIGEYEYPRALAFDGNDLWVLYSGEGGHLEEFDPSGDFMKAVGSGGSGPGQFNRPEGIAILPNGHILVSDAGEDRIDELDGAGEWIGPFGPGGSGEIEPTGIGVSPEGKVWVADPSHDRVIELGASGEVIRSVGSEGTGNGQFGGPGAIAVGALGEVWIGDEGNDRIQELDKEGKYIAQFGSAGSGLGQLSFGYPMGIAADGEGGVFVTDNSRVEHWRAPRYAGAFGSTGTGEGRFEHPAGMAVGRNGDLWVVDSEDNRLEEFDKSGGFVHVFVGNGQLKHPASVAFSPEGDLWVSEPTQDRLQEFSESGAFIRSVGVLPGSPYSIESPQGIANSSEGDIWVSDSGNGRIVELDENGGFIREYKPTGTAAIQPRGIAVGPGGNVWFTDHRLNRVIELNSSGELVRQFGTTGTGPGQFKGPDAITVDGQGTVWVTDDGNGRVQGFNESGEYLTQLGAAGSGPGRFSLVESAGIASDDKGGLWVADSGDNRVEDWHTGSWVPAEEETTPTHDDPSVDVNTSSGLVTSVVGAEAGSHHYGHQGELLTSDEGPEGTTQYEYEPDGQLKKITLSNGTTAAIEYDGTGRATEVTVTPAGSGAKTTRFYYTQEINPEVAKAHGVASGSREVMVEPEGENRTFYAIDGAGDVVESWNVEIAPTIFSENGTLTQVSNEKQIESNDTQELFIKAFAPEGIRKIQFIVNGSTIVDEKTCAGTATECEYETLQWIVEPEDLPAGTMWIEVVITSRVEEHGEPRRSSARWWVTVPYIPPSIPGIPQPAKYKKVLEFREAMGLDLDLNPVADELELHARIWETIDAWWNPATPAGQVANATWERWGMPLRYVDEQELEYREAYVAHDVPLIEQWAKSHYPNTFAGVYLDERAGGLLRVGFTGEQAASQAALENGAGLMAPGRVGAFVVAPARGLAALEATQEAVETASEEYPEGLIVSYGIDVASNTVSVGATNVAEAESLLRGSLGSGAPITVTHSEALQVAAQWQNESGPILGGEYVRSGHGGGCSAGLGAVQKFANGTRKYFLMSAAHCGDLGQTYRRFASSGAGKEIGKVVRSGWGPRVGVTADGEAIEVTTSSLAPTAIDLGSGGTWAIDGSQPPPPRGNWLCHVGARTQERLCGPVLPRKSIDTSTNGRHGRTTCFEAEGGKGDSGAPVWINGTHTVVGLVSGYPRDTEIRPEFGSVTCFTPLQPTAGRPLNEGILTNQEMVPLQLRTDNAP